MKTNCPAALLTTSVNRPSLVNESLTTVEVQGVSNFIRQAASERLERLVKDEALTRNKLFILAKKQNQPKTWLITIAVEEPLEKNDTYGKPPVIA